MDNICIHLDPVSNDGTESATCALGNDVIVTHLFKFLLPNDLKSCRAVCDRWRRIAEPTFKNQMRVCVYFGDCENGKTNSFAHYSAPTDLNHYFENSHREVPFEALSLGNSLPWSTTTLEGFFSTDGRFITDLTLTDVKLYNADKLDGFIETLDLSIILQGILNLKRIDVQRNDRFYKDMTCFIISTKFLSTVKEQIRLWNCTLEILRDYRISPAYLTLKSIQFIGDILDNESIILNEFIDFSVLKIMTILSFNYIMPHSHSLKIDFQGSWNIDTLYLRHVDISSIDNSNWNVNYLCVDDISFTRATNMRITNFRSSGLLVLKHVPQSCERLSLGPKTNFPENMQWNFNMPNVKSLVLESYYIVYTLFPNIMLCFNNLVELTLKSHSHPSLKSVIIDMELIPKSVKKLALAWNGFTFVGGGVRVLDDLVFQFETLEIPQICEFANKVLNHFTPNTFIVFIENPQASDGEELLAALSHKLVNQMIVGLFDLCPLFHGDMYWAFPRAPNFGSADEFYAVENKSGELIKHRSYNEIQKRLL